MRNGFLTYATSLLVMAMLSSSAQAQPPKTRMVIAGPGYMWGIDDTIVKELKAEGVEVLTYPDTPMIDGPNQPPVIRSWAQLRRFNILIFGDQFYNRGQPNADTGQIPEHIRNTVPLLYRFLREGGGIFFSGPGEADFGNTVRTMNIVMKELDVHAIQEVIKDPNTLARVHRGRFGEWCWTDAVSGHPLTNGVKGIWYPAAHAGDGGMGIVPSQVGPAWSVLVRGMPTATSFGIDPNDPAGTKLLKTPGIVKASPNMIAVRQYGKGRVVFWPMWSPFGVFAGSWYADGLLMDGERNGRKSNGKQLIKNLLYWLAEPSQGSKTIGLFDPATAKPPKPRTINVDAKLAAWRSSGRKDYPAQFKGLIGAHSSLSDGQSSPEEMIAAAKAAAYDFIAFTEDLTKMNEEKWQRLVAACDKAGFGDAVLASHPNSGWSSRKRFSQPIRVEFLGVSLDQHPRSGWNSVGLGRGGLADDTIVWAFDGSVKPRVLVPMRCLRKKGFWNEGYRKAVPFSKLGDLTKPENGVDLRIDWWPGKKIAYYVNGRSAAAFTKSVPAGPLPVGVRNETLGFRIRVIRVTSLAGKRKVLLEQDFTRTRHFDTAGTWEVVHGKAPIVRRSAGNFIAYPGLDCLDDAGNRVVVFGNRWWPNKEGFSAKNPGRLTWWYALSYQMSNAAQTWAPRVIIRSKTNNKRPWDQALWSLFSPYCYEGGKLADDSFHEWRRMIKRHVFFFNTGVVVVHTVHSSGEIAASATEGLYQTYVRADNLAQVLSRVTGCVGPMAYFPSYISAGPEILDFRTHAVSGGEGLNLAIPRNDRFLLHVLVCAEAGLKEVSVFDGERLVRRFLPREKRFEEFLTFHPDEHHAFSLTVTDKKDRKAVSWNAWMQVQERVHRRCGDNWNYMMTGKPRRAGRPRPRMQEATDLGNGEPAYFCEPARFAHGGLQPAIGRYMTPDFQSLLVDGKPWPGNHAVHVLDFTTVGRYGIILTNVVRQDYLVKRPDAFTIGAFQGPYAVIDTPWPADLKQWAPEPRFNGPLVRRYAGRVIFKREVTRPHGAPVKISLGASDWTGHNPVRKQGCVLEVLRPDGTSEKILMSKLKDDSAYDDEIPVNGCFAWHGPDAPGVGGVIALSPGIRYNFYKKGTYSWLSLYKQVPTPVRPGTQVTWDCLYVDGSRSTRDSAEEVDDVRLGLGVAGKPTLYKVHARIGKVAEQKLFLTLRPEDHGFSGRIVKTTAKLLPLHLPVYVLGLNPRWDACLWYRGKTHLEVMHKYRDPWGVESPYRMTAAYEPRADEIQYIPVIEGGVGYCQVDTDKQNPDVFIGHPLVCDQPVVFLTLVKAKRGQCTFEINNPTDKTLTCTVRPAKGFDLTGEWKQTVTLPPGSIMRGTAHQSQAPAAQ